MVQLHKKFSNAEVKALFNRYLDNEIKAKQLQIILGLKRSQFFNLLKQFKTNPDTFTIDYKRTAACRKISVESEKIILKELEEQKKLIELKDVPVHKYNYSFIKDRIKKDHNIDISINPIIARAKHNGFYKKKKLLKTHDREVITNFAGELVQHDSSLHLFAPDSKEKWTLITSIDDFSRFMLYAAIVKKESTWAHITAIKSVCLRFGAPTSYYADSHSIFRFVRERDELRSKHHKLTDDVNPQWRQVCYDCNVKVINALSPQAKGKVERAYGWIQDHLVRLCFRQNVNAIKQAQRILFQEVEQYNYKRIHSTTREVPYYRFQRAIKDNQSLFRPFMLKPPYRSTKDIFCFRLDRVVDQYRTISIDNIKLKVNASPRQSVNLRISPFNRKIAEVRIWYHNTLVDIQKIKISDLKSVHF